MIARAVVAFELLSFLGSLLTLLCFGTADHALHLYYRSQGTEGPFPVYMEQIIIYLTGSVSVVFALPVIYFFARDSLAPRFRAWRKLTPLPMNHDAIEDKAATKVIFFSLFMGVFWGVCEVMFMWNNAVNVLFNTDCASLGNIPDGSYLVRDCKFSKAVYILMPMTLFCWACTLISAFAMRVHVRKLLRMRQVAAFEAAEKVDEVVDDKHNEA